MKPYQHAKEIMQGKSMLAVIIGAAEILSDREQINIAMEHEPYSVVRSRSTVLQQIEDTKLEIPRPCAYRILLRKTSRRNV